MEYLLAPLFILALVCIYVFISSPAFAVAVVLITTIANTWLIEMPSVQIGLNIYPQDVIFLAIFVAAMLRIILKGGGRPVPVSWYMLGLLIFYSLVTGLMQNGTLAGVDFRNTFYYWTGAFYFMTYSFGSDDLKKMLKVWVYAVVVLVIIVLFRFLAEYQGLPIAQTWISADSTGVRFRVINSAQSYIMGVGVVILFYQLVVRDKDKPSKLLLVLAALCVIGLQHRSVWVATLISVMSLFILPGRHKASLVGNTGLLAGLAVLLVMPFIIFGLLDTLTESVVDSAQRAADTTTGTFGNRVQFWGQIMDYWWNSNVLHQTFGESFGSGYAGIERSPHNYYFQVLLRGGVVGVFLLLTVMLGTLLKLFRRSLLYKGELAYGNLFFMLLVGQMLFYIPYSPSYEHGIILGIASSIARRGVSA